MKQTKLMIATTLTAALASWGCAPSHNAANVAARVSAATDTGPISPNELIDFVVGLRVSDYAGIDQAIAQIAAGTAAVLSPTDFADRFGISASEYAAVETALLQKGFEIVRTSPGRTTITVRGSAAAIESAFGTTLHQYTDQYGSFRSPTAEPVFGGVFAPISGAVGLSTASRWTSDRHVTPFVATATYTPTALRTLYNVPATITGGSAGTGRGAGETIAILGAGNPPDLTDVATFADTYAKHTLATGQYTQQLVGGANRDDAAEANDELGENVLDIDMVLAIAPEATVVHAITATNSPGLFTDGISYIVNQVPQAHAVTVSFSSCERGAASEMPVVHALLAQAKLAGQQWFFASGDNGTDGCQGGKDGQVLSVGWPASDPYAIGVGGEQINSADGSEAAWGEQGGGGGGGQSESFDKPSYQTGVGPYPTDGARDEPDVAALAGAPGVVTYQNGSPSGSEGTSAATPMWAGVWALIDQSQGGSTPSMGAPNGLGLPTGLENLYRLGKAGNGFRDITQGTNGNGSLAGFPAIAGYDLATGWGVPNVTSLIANWSN